MEKTPCFTDFEAILKDEITFSATYTQNLTTCAPFLLCCSLEMVDVCRKICSIFLCRLNLSKTLSHTNNMKNDEVILSRAQGCLLGQCVGDALGQMVEFRRKEEIFSEYPNGVRDMADGGTWNTLAGQPTDDTELALMLARSIIQEKKFDPKKVLVAYQYWLKSRPFDCGKATYHGLSGHPLEDSQGNGSLMRISPLGVYGSRFDLDTVADWAMQDSLCTHPHAVCQKAVAIFATTIAEAIATGLDKHALYENALKRAKEEKYFEPFVFETLQNAGDSPPERYGPQCGWIRIAFQNAFYRLLHAKDAEQAIIETVNEGGDTDTNGAICGALVGAVYGIESIPERWRTVILNCRPSQDNPAARRPRPECFWAVDVLEIAEKLLTV